jgi:hypothetical protein
LSWTHLQPIPSAIPFHGCSKVFAVQCNIVESAKVFFVAAQGNPILARLIHSNAVICEALRGVEVEDEQQSGTLVHNCLVNLVLQGHVCLKYRVSNRTPPYLTFNAPAENSASRTVWPDYSWRYQNCSGIYIAEWDRPQHSIVVLHNGMNCCCQHGGSPTTGYRTVISRWAEMVNETVTSG